MLPFTYIGVILRLLFRDAQCFMRDSGVQLQPTQLAYESQHRRINVTCGW